jgi:hypothetical protein
MNARMQNILGTLALALIAIFIVVGNVQAAGITNSSPQANFTGIMPVVDGGTGAGTLTSHGVLLGAGTSAVSATAAPDAGTLLAGNSSGVPVFVPAAFVCTLNAASPAVCTITVPAASNCTATVQGTTAAAALHTVAINLSGTTLTLTGANGLNDVFNVHCH